MAGILAVLALIYVFNPSHSFFSAYTQKTLFHQVALFGVLSIGAALVIITGGSTCRSARWWPWHRS